MLSVSRVLGSSDIQGRPANPPHRAGRARQSPSQARDRWGRGPFRRPPRSRHLGRLSRPLRPVSCSLFVPVRWRSFPGGGAMGSPGWGIRSLSGHPDTAENKERKMPKTKGRLGAHGLGRGLIDWRCEWRCPLSGVKRTSPHQLMSPRPSPVIAEAPFCFRHFSLFVFKRSRDKDCSPMPPVPVNPSPRP